MSRYSQGVPTREPLNTPCNSRVWLARALIRSPTFCSSFRPRLPRSSMMILKPPVVPRPSTGGAPNACTIAPRTAVRQRLTMAAPMAVAVRSRLSRSANGLSRTYREPRLGALAERISDWPETPTVCSTPGVSRAICSMRAMRRSVRSTEAASGNCTFRSRYPLSCSGMKPVGAAASCQPVSPSRPPYSSRTIRLTRRTPLTIAP